MGPQPAAVKLPSRRGSLPIGDNRECNIVLEKMPVVPQGATQKSSLPSIIKGLQKNAQALISKGWQKTPSYLHAFKQNEETPSSKTTSKETSDSKGKLRIVVKPPVRAPMSPEAVLREFKSCLTKHELGEIRDYKEVWYWGNKANKIKTSQTQNGCYTAIINDHLAYRFQILEVIGTGYSGEVIKCLDHKTKERVAVKVFRDNSSEDLYRALKRTKKPGFSERELRKYTMDMLKCLQLLKKNNIVHGDLKTNNILVLRKDREKHVAVGDYGGSYLTTESHKPPIHTLNYVAPELLLCILAELHIGHLLFIGSNNLCQFRHIMEVLGVPPSNLLDKAPNRDMFFDSEGLPLQMEKITRNSTTLAKKLGSKNAEFVDFIEGCLQYNPKKRMTPEQAMHHPWITQKSKYAAAAAKSRSDAPVSSSGKKPAPPITEKMTPVQPGKA
uniref:dual-specificity kinase n=1 Tax=Scophthalmus maximus TaxID=52904 RepID=A0A8D3B1L9_SCOMX